MSTSREDFEAWVMATIPGLKVDAMSQIDDQVSVNTWSLLSMPWQARDAEVESLKAENASLRQRAEAEEADARRFRWQIDNPLWSIGYRIKVRREGRTYTEPFREYRMYDNGDPWGSWWPTQRQAIDAAIDAQRKEQKA